ncbi:MAG: hypothetical protein M1510_00975 [Nitrospirae bacterium]|nr:hypothetical protein [Nitrospirota bacterium]
MSADIAAFGVVSGNIAKDSGKRWVPDHIATNDAHRGSIFLAIPPGHIDIMEEDGAILLSGLLFDADFFGF